MNLTDALNAGTLHHAYVIAGEPAQVRSLAERAIGETLSFPLSGNPDLYRVDVDTFTIDEGRAIQQFAVQTPVAYGRKIVLLSFRRMTREAQNALLKLFEEPPAHTHFFLITPTAAILLPTLRSRLTPCSVAVEGMAEHERAARTFLAAYPPARLEQVARIVADKDRAQALDLLNRIERVFYDAADLHTSEHAQALEEIERARGYLNDQGSSVKMLLEHIALVVPVVRE